MTHPHASCIVPPDDALVARLCGDARAAIAWLFANPELWLATREALPSLSCPTPSREGARAQRRAACRR